jgi:hypothetical protein
LDSTRDAARTTIRPGLDRYKAGLAGDGYRVIETMVNRVDIPRTAGASTTAWKNAVASTKAQIDAAVAANPDLAAIVLVGHVPVPYSGLRASDRRADHVGAWPADMYYSPLVNDAGVSVPASTVWTDAADPATNTSNPDNQNVPGDGKWDQDYLPPNVNVKIPVGRIDFANMPLFGSATLPDGRANVIESRMLNQYFEKNYAFRFGEFTATSQALTRDGIFFGSGVPQEFSSNPSRVAVASNVGRTNISLNASVNGYAPDFSQHALHTQSWTFLYLGGNYSYSALFGDTLLLNPDTDGLATGHYVDKIYGRHNAVFNFLHAPWIGDWDKPDSLLRAPLAEAFVDGDGFGLASAAGNLPRLHVHHMAVGETVGTAMKISQNATDDEYPNVDGLPEARSTEVSLMGDAALRERYVKPVDYVTAVPNANSVTISWPSVQGAFGYYLYRSSDPTGLGWGLPIATGNTQFTSYVDTTTSSTAGVYYAVRPVHLVTTAGGSYFDLGTARVARPRLLSSVFDFDRHLSNGSGNPDDPDYYKQWTEVRFDQSMRLTDSDVDIRGFRLGSSTEELLTKGVDFRVLPVDAGGKIWRVVYLDTSTGLPGLSPSGQWTLVVGDQAFSQLAEPIGTEQSFSFNFLLGDVNGDNTVNYLDLLILSQHYGQATPDPNSPAGWGDLNADGVVDLTDLLILQQQFGLGF